VAQWMQADDIVADRDRPTFNSEGLEMTVPESGAEAVEVADPNLGVEAPRPLLLNEHRSLLSSVTPTRLVNRLLIVGLLLLELTYGTSLVWGHLLILVAAGTLLSAFWTLYEFSVQRNIDSIESVIAQEVQDPAAEAWLRAYINWRYVRWEQARSQAIQRLDLWGGSSCLFAEPCGAY
jgi:hypothetical protein